MAQYTFELPDRVVNACALQAGWQAGDPDTQLQAGIKAILSLVNTQTDGYLVDQDVDTERSTSESTQENSINRASEV